MAQNLEMFRLPKWDKLPDIELYLDQVVKYLTDHLEPFHANKSEKIITKMMINNYVKQGVLTPPVKKKYNKNHIAYLFIICLMKQVYSMNDLKALIRLALGVSSVETTYDKFCVTLEQSIKCTFENSEFVDAEPIGRGRILLKCAIQSYANKLYVEKTFLHKKDNQ